MSRPLQDKVALVTGASRGIGAAIARRLAQDGAKVVVNYAQSKPAAEAVVQSIRAAGGEAVLAPGDVAAPDGPERIVDAARKAFGRLDILVNNAGVLDAAPLADATPEHYERTFAVNVFGLVQVTRAAAPHLPDGSGRIVNTSSIGARGAFASLSAYIASKAAIDAITRSTPAGVCGSRRSERRRGRAETLAAAGRIPMSAPVRRPVRGRAPAQAPD